MDTLAKDYVRMALLQLEPLPDVIELVQTPQDMYYLRSVLKQVPYSEEVVRHFAKIMVDAVSSGRRFRQFECLKVLRAIAKDQTKPQLSCEAISLLFQLYQHYIFHHRNEVQWCVSALLRGRPLIEEELDWLLARWEDSEHFINRILRYPVYHPKLAAWAAQVYRHHLLEDRLSELIALAIVESIPDFAQNEPSDDLIWAIYYSKASQQVKELLLLERFDSDALDSYVEVSLRLQSKRALRYALEQSDTQQGHKLRAFGVAGRERR